MSDDNMGTFITWLREDLKQYPIVLFVVLAYGAAISYIAVQYATKADIVNLEDKISGLNTKVSDLNIGINRLDTTSKFNHIDTEIGKTRDKIFDAEQRIREDAKRHLDPDEPTLRRLGELKNLLDDQKAEMERLHAPPR